MVTKGSLLTTPADFDNAMFFGLPIEVWEDRRLILCGGRITKHTDGVVYIDSDDERYFKQLCVFKVR